MAGSLLFQWVLCPGLEPLFSQMGAFRCGHRVVARMFPVPALRRAETANVRDKNRFITMGLRLSL